jgi:hypothetical protein
VDNILDLVRVLAKRHPEVAWEGGELHETARLGAWLQVCHPKAAWARVGGGGWVVEHIQRLAWMRGHVPTGLVGQARRGPSLLDHRWIAMATQSIGFRTSHLHLTKLANRAPNSIAFFTDPKTVTR